jgi:hypothetical protein
MDHIDPIGRSDRTGEQATDRCSLLDGVVLVDPEYVKDRKVYASVLAGA